MTGKQAESTLHRILERLRDAGALPQEHGFSARAGAHFATIAGHLASLYGARADFEALLERIVRTMADARLERADELRELDEHRLENPRWYLSNELVSTMLYVDRYAGSLGALEERIPYLKELGINLVHLMPLQKCPEGQSDGGYAVSDYRAVDPKLGSMEELRRVRRRFHEEGMLLQLDLVVNHTSDEHEWAQRARAGEKRYQDYYYMFESRMIPDRFEASMPEVFPESAPGNFTYVAELERYVMTVFHDYQWDLNYTNPEVLIEMLDVLFFFANLGVDVIRLDAVPFLWKRIGTTGQNLPEAHMILQLFHACLRVVAPASALMAEAVVEPKEIVRYFGEGDYAGRECEMAYHVFLMVLLWDCIATGNTRLLRRGLETTHDIPHDVTWFTYIRCHDDIGLGYADDDIREAGYDPTLHRQFILEYYTGEYPGSTARGQRFMADPESGDARISGTAASLLGLEYAKEQGDEEELSRAIDRLTMLYGLVCSIGGIPILYYGDEVGYSNDYSYREEPGHRHDNRWMHRPRIDWQHMERRHEEGTAEERVFSRITNLVGVRKSLPELGADAGFALLHPPNEHLVAFLRYTPEARTLVVANVSGLPQYTDAALLSQAGITAPAHDAISGDRVQPVSRSLVLEPYRIYWLRETLRSPEHVLH